MQNPNEQRRYIEDDFELSDFKKRFVKLKRKNERIRKNRKIARLLSVISVILLIFVAFFFNRTLNYYAEMKKNTLTNKLAHEIAVTGIDTTADFKTDDLTASGASIETRPVLDKISRLRETFSNDDIVAYLKIDGTAIDYAVAQTKDNEFYLNRDLYTEKNVAGSIFMDYECDPFALSQNTVIYGHNMRNGSMFHNLRNFADKDYCMERRFISLTTPYEETTWEVFAFYQTGTDFYYIQVFFPDDDSFMSLVSMMKEKSMYDTGVEVLADDKILTLSTCANTTDDTRYVLNAKLVVE